MTARTSHPIIDSLTANSDWVDSLLELFWAVDQMARDDRKSRLSVAVLEAYYKAEAARLRL